MDSEFPQKSGQTARLPADQPASNELAHKSTIDPHKSLPDWLEDIEQRHYQLTGKSIDLGLERLQLIAQDLGLFSDKPIRHKAHAKVITVAGTNGKGSFVASADALLRQQGLKTACYTSPHILKFNERIVINGQPVDDETLIRAFEIVEQAQTHRNIQLSFFEFTTLSAFIIFSQHDLDVLLLEVGLGGRLDAVNIIEPDLAVITSIALDHQDFLGDELDGIAREKCGILRASTPLVLLTNQDLPSLNQACCDRAAIVLGRDILLTQDWQNESWQFEIAPSLNAREDVEHLLQSLAPYEHDVFSDKGLAVNSQLGALLAIHWLTDVFVDDDPAYATFKQAFHSQLYQGELKPAHEAFDSLSLPGRFQQFDVDGVNVAFDVAHNEQALQALLTRLQAQPLKEGAKRVALFSMLDGKPLEQTVSLLKDEFFAWFLAESSDARALKPSFIAEKLHAQGIHMISVSKNFTQAYARLRQMCQPGDQIIVFGSFVAVSALLPKVSRLASKFENKPEQGMEHKDG